MSSITPQHFLAAARRLSPKLITWRRHLHANPELSFEEYNTQIYLETQLQQLGYSNISRIADTGLILTLNTNRTAGNSKNVVAIRADIDALPIQEVSGRSYGSKVPNVMHACGHDVHSTCALGAAAILRELAKDANPNLRIIFQPGEELLPGGATKVIAEGGLDDVKAIVGLHVDPSIPVGSFGTRAGAYMASTDELHLTLNGGGGHAAMPHQHTDLIAAFSSLVTELQLLLNRKGPATVPTVLSWGRVDSTGGATNVLCSQLRAQGTFRTYDQTWREEAHQLLSLVAQQVAIRYGAEIELEIRSGYPALTNDAATTASVTSTLEYLVGKEHVQPLAMRPTAEDFAWYLQHVPGCFFRLGVRNEARGITAGVHQTDFDVDEDCLAYGAAALASTAWELLKADL